MTENFEKMEKRIEEYFDGVSDKQLQKDLEKAGYSFYKNVKTPVLDGFLEQQEFSISPKPMTPTNISVEILYVKLFSTADSYTREYKMAA